MTVKELRILMSKHDDTKELQFERHVRNRNNKPLKLKEIKEEVEGVNIILVLSKDD